MRSQVKDAKNELEKPLDLLRVERRRNDVLDAELTHARAELLEADGRLDRLAGRLDAAQLETRRLGLIICDISRDIEIKSGALADCEATIVARDATIEGLVKALGQRDHELAIARGHLAELQAARAAPRIGTAQAAGKEERASGVPAAALQRRLRQAEEDAALFKALSSMMQGMLQVLASRGKWWSAALPDFWVRRMKYDRMRRKGLFDSELYAKRYPDVIRAGMDPLHHYVSHGLEEGRTRM